MEKYKDIPFNNISSLSITGVNTSVIFRVFSSMCLCLIHPTNTMTYWPPSQDVHVNATFNNNINNIKYIHISLFTYVKSET